MTSTIDLTFPRGDSKVVPYQLKDSAGNPLDLTAPVVFKMSVKEEADDDEALILKTNRDVNEIEITDIPNGRVAVKLLKADTYALDPGCYRYDVEMTKAGAELTAAEGGTCTVSNGSAVIVGIGTDFTKLHVGDLIVLGTAVNVENRFPVEVVEITDGTHVTVDFSDWTPEAGIDVDECYLGDVKTVVIGCLTLTSDVTR